MVGECRLEDWDVVDVDATGGEGIEWLVGAGSWGWLSVLSGYCKSWYVEQEAGRFDEYGAMYGISEEHSM